MGYSCSSLVTCKCCYHCLVVNVVKMCNVVEIAVEFAWRQLRWDIRGGNPSEGGGGGRWLRNSGLKRGG